MKEACRRLSGNAGTESGGAVMQMDLSELQVNISYITYGKDNIRDALIIPALKSAKHYKRSVGFFSSSVFDTILDGVIDLSRRGGRIQIIASPHLSRSDVEAISLGYQAREKVCKDAFLRDFEEALMRLSDRKFRLSAQLIACGTLDIKITDLDCEDAEVSEDGDYHDKLGIILDESGNAIVFVGSPNETVNGYKKNYEKVRVFRSWIPAQNEYVQDELEEFDSLWNGVNPYLKTYTFGDALAGCVIQTERARKAASGPGQPVRLRDYQQEAIRSWVANGCRGFYVMATGTGKTWTAIYSAIELQKEQDCLTVICAPYKHLVRQWAEDLAKAMPEAAQIMVFSENPGWDRQLTQAIVRQRLRRHEKIVVISTIKSFLSERFRQTIQKSNQRKLLIADEAHRFTARPDTIQEQYQYMLGLSATPFSGKNTAKGRELMDFFGGQVYHLPIECALERGLLVPYDYHPILVCATQEEERQFRQKTAQIAGCFKNGICVDPDSLALHLRARLRIISMAQEKIDRIDEIMGQIRQRDHLIVYCGDGRLWDGRHEEIRHIQFVKRKLSALGYKASQFTASETMPERMELVEVFDSGEIDALAAIRCLDEGINIPSIQGALILSSSDDYREFVQRRGRILRTCAGKACADIYDVIVLPSAQTPAFAEIELRRFYEYARLARNAEACLAQLATLAAGCGLELNDFVTAFDDVKEADLDE